MDLLNNKIQQIPGVISTETLISLDQSIKRDIPIEQIRLKNISLEEEE
jgi:Lrp/AsnC family transcriptional regulator for asnA, asnC and gidA